MCPLLRKLFLMQVFLNYKSVLVLLLSLKIFSQPNDSVHMNTQFYISDLDNPVSLDFKSVRIKPSEEKAAFNDYEAPGGTNGYFSRYNNSERNSRLNSPLPETDLWEVKWLSSVNSSYAPWYLMIKNNRILLQNESGWQLFDISGKKIGEGTKAQGEIILSQAEDVFYFNDHSGYIQAVDLITGKEKFNVYPFLGKGFERSVIAAREDKIIIKAFELPVMTHSSTIKIPETNILEIIKLGTSRETDRDGVLRTSEKSENLILKSSKIITAVHDSQIIAAVPNHIFIVDEKLQITKDFTGDFIPLEMSVDEEMRLYLIVQTEIENEFITQLWMLSSEGSLLFSKSITPVGMNYLIPPAIDYNHCAYVMYEQKITAITSTGDILWDEYVQQPLSGFSSGKDYLLVSEGTLLTAFNHQGVRKLIYNFDENLSSPALLFNDEIFVVTRNNLFCLKPKKNN